MRLLIAAAGLCALGLLAQPRSAAAEDRQAGTPLAPPDAAGSWTLASAGHDLCVVTLGKARAGAGYAVTTPPDCGDALPGAAAAWQPTTDGMRLLDADGRELISFNRWSNSLLVSHRASGVDVQLRRGAAGS